MATASQIGMCPAAQQMADGLSARRSRCFYGGSPPVVSWPCMNETPGRVNNRVMVRAQDTKRGTRIFKFNNKSKKESEEVEEAGPGTRLFRFGLKKPAQEEEEAAEEPKFGTQIFKTLSSLSPKKESAGAVKGGALVPKKESTALSFTLPRSRQDPKTAFVAGATGQIGARIVQKLLRQGFNVRGGVRDLFVAQQLAEFATQYGVVSREEAKRLNAVEFDFKDTESIAKAIGSASKVVVTIGPTEDGPNSKVSFNDALNVVEAAKLANVTNVVVVYEPGTGAPTVNPLAGLTSFFSELFSKPVAVSISELINQIVETGLSYTLLKTSSTDGVDDISYNAPNIELRKEGTPVSVEGTKIAKGQVATIVAEILVNPVLAENKVIEAYTSLSAAAVPISELLSAIPVDNRREALAAARAKAEEEEKEKAAKEKAEAEARAAVEEARKATQLAAQLEAEAKQLAAQEAKAVSLAEKAQAQAAAATASVDSLAGKLKDLRGGDVFSKASAKAAKPESSVKPSFSLPAFPSSSVKVPSIPKPAAATASKSSSPSPPPKKQREPVAPTPSPGQKPQVNSIFGGLFSQETIYVDEA